MGNSKELHVDKFIALVGSDRFYDAPEILQAYSKDHSFVPSREPMGVIKPKNTDQIKDIVDLANETLVPIIPISSGFPKFHGDTIPACPGMSVDLSDLNQVLRVDRRNKIAAIDPGVTFGKLRKALESHGLVPYTPLLPRSTKSVLASTLEGEPITVPKDHWDFTDPLVGGRIVYGDGHTQGFNDTAGHTKKEVKTGEAIPTTPMGVSVIGFPTMVRGAQGTLGIVQWGAVFCRVKPNIQKPYFIAEQNLTNILPFLQSILKRRFVEELFILNGSGLANLLSEDADEIGRIRAGLAPWVLFINIAGYERYPEEEIGWKEEQLQQAAVEAGVELKEAVGGFSAARLVTIMEKTADKDRRLRYKASCQDLIFSTTLDRTPELTSAIVNTAGDYGYPPADLTIYIQPVIQGCQSQCEVVFPYNPEDEQEVNRVKLLFMATARKLSGLGAYYSRPYGSLSDITYMDATVCNVLKKIKRIWDPNDIMNPGKLCF